MFTAYNRNSFNDKQVTRAVEVYDIQYNKSGYPMFLVRECGQWVKRSAKHYLTKEEVYGNYLD